MNTLYYAGNRKLGAQSGKPSRNSSDLVEYRGFLKVGDGRVPVLPPKLVAGPDTPFRKFSSPIEVSVERPSTPRVSSKSDARFPDCPTYLKPSPALSRIVRSESKFSWGAVIEHIGEPKHG